MVEIALDRCCFELEIAKYLAQKPEDLSTEITVTPIKMGVSLKNYLLYYSPSNYNIFNASLISFSTVSSPVAILSIAFSADFLSKPRETNAVNASNRFVLF